MSWAGTPERAFRNPATSAMPRRPAPDPGEHAHQPAHHLPEEVRAHDAHEDQRALLGHLAPLEEHARRALLGIEVGEGLEVVHAAEQRRRLGHPPHVQVVLDPPDERLREGGPAARDLVQVAARERAVAGVEPAADRLHREHVHVARQLVVELHAQDLRRHRRQELDVRDLPQRVHPGIGPPRAVELERRGVDHRRDRAVELPLHGAGVLLHLPPAVARAGVFERQLVTRHSITCVYLLPCYVYSSAAPMPGAPPRSSAQTLLWRKRRRRGRW